MHNDVTDLENEILFPVAPGEDLTGKILIFIELLSKGQDLVIVIFTSFWNSSFKLRILFVDESAPINVRIKHLFI